MSVPDEVRSALVEREAGDYRTAIETLGAYFRAGGKDARALALHGHLMLIEKRGDEAAKSIREALAEGPGEPAAHRSHARLLLSQGQVEAAILAGRKAFDLGSPDHETILVLAVALIAGGQMGLALDLLEQALAARPDYPEALAQRAFIRASKGDLPGARNDAEFAVSAKPHLGQVWRFLGSLCLQANDAKRGLEAFEASLRLDENNLSDMLVVGDLRRQSGDLSGGMSILEAAVKLYPDSGEALANLGTCYQQAGRPDAAKDAYRRALSLAPGLAAVANNLGALAKEEGAWDQALGYFTGL